MDFRHKVQTSQEILALLSRASAPPWPKRVRRCNKCILTWYDMREKRKEEATATRREGPRFFPSSQASNAFFPLFFLTFVVFAFAPIFFFSRRLSPLRERERESREGHRLLSRSTLAKRNPAAPAPCPPDTLSESGGNVEDEPPLQGGVKQRRGQGFFFSMASSNSPSEQLLLARLRQLVPASAAEPADRSSSLFFHASCDVSQKVKKKETEGKGEREREHRFDDDGRQRRSTSASFFLHSSFPSQVRIRVDGLAPGWRGALSRSLRGGANEDLLGSLSSSPAALRVRATLSGFFGGGGGGGGGGQELCPASETPPFDADADAAGDGRPDAALLTFPVAYSDLPSDAVVTLELQLIAVFPRALFPSLPSPSGDSLRALPVAAGRQRLFSRHGALKTGPREVDLLPVVAGGGAAGQRRGRQRPPAPSGPPGAAAPPPPARLRLLRLRARRLARGDLGRTPWLDGQSLEAAARELSSSSSPGRGGGGGGRAGAAALAAEAAAALAEAAACSPPAPSAPPPLPPSLPPPRLSISLPSFGRPVLFDDPSPPASDAAASSGGAGARAAAASSRAARASAAAEGALSRAAAAADAAALSAGQQQAEQQQRRRPRFRPLFDPEAGLDSPAELKASLLAARGAGGRGAGERGGKGGKGGGGGRNGGDRSARPDAAERAAIDALLWQPPGRPLAAADRALLWRFRWHLASSSASDSGASDGRALALVLRAASSMPGGRGGGKGGGSSEVSLLIAASKAASAASPSSSSAAGPCSSASAAGGGNSGSPGNGGNVIQGALSLLGPELAALPAARERAAEILARAPEEELELYLLFLVQALRFERGGEGGGSGGEGAAGDGDNGPAGGGSALADVLVSRAVASPRLALALHWHLVVEFGDATFGARAAALHSRLQAELKATAEGGGRGGRGGAGSPTTAPASSSFSASSSSSRKALAAASAMAEQVSFVARVRELAEALTGTRTAAAKGEKLRAALLSKAAAAKAGKAGGTSAVVDGLVVVAPPSSSSSSSASSSRVLLSPVDPSAALVRVAPERCAVFKSALAPLLLSFDSVSVPSDGDDESGLVSAPAAVASAREALAAAAAAEKQRRGSSSEGGGGLLSHLPHLHSHPGHIPRPPHPKLDLRRSDLIFKRGDDLRQDALVLALLRVADAALKREGLDLKLTPYSVLPTSPTDGFIELVRDAPPLSAVLLRHRTVSAYLRSVSLPSPGSPGGISPGVMDTYSRSLAGWAALTYALGVGDRHADNVLVCRDGRVCHVDFGFILGRDPRPWGAPPLRLARELLEPLGWGGGGGGGGSAAANEGGGSGGGGAPSLQQQQQQAAPSAVPAPPPQPSQHQQQPSSSEAYDRFLALACEAFGVLRSPNAAPQLIGALHLASRCAAPDIARAPAKAVLFVSDRLRPGDRDGEAAARALADAIAEGAAALVPALLETTHRWAQSWR